MAKYGDEGKSFVVKQKVKGNKENSTYDLKLHIKQKENSYLIAKTWNPQIHAYYIGKREKYFIFKPFNRSRIKRKMVSIEDKYAQKIENNKNDSLKVAKFTHRKNKKTKKQKKKLAKGTWFTNTIGEKPEFLDSTNVEFSREQLELYLNSKGFFGAKVKTTVSTTKSRSVITYTIEENKAHKIDSVSIKVIDKKLTKLLITDFEKNTLLKQGENFDVGQITAERERITKKMKNNGYFDFERQEIYFDVDTTLGNHKVSIQLIVNTPPDKFSHTLYTVKQVIYSEDIATNSTPDSTLLQGIKYFHSNKRKISTKILNRKIKIRTNALYNFEDAQLTQRLLSNLNSFKFVNINYQKLDSNSLVAYINTSNMKKYGLTAEGGVNVNVNQGQGLPGPFVSMSWMSRRFFRGYELFEISGKYSFQSQPNIIGSEKNYKTREAGLNASLTFPKLLFPLGVNDLLWKTIPKTRLSIGYTDIVRVEYDRSSINGAITYSGFWNKNARWNFALSELSIVNSRRISGNFSDYLDDLSEQGNNLKQSFKSAIISNTNFSYVFNNNDATKNNRAKFYLFHIELGGPLYSLIRRGNKKWGNGSFNNEVLGLPFYEYFKMNFDARKYFPVTKNSSINFRVNTGFAIPYGSDELSTLPYEKFSFAGGLNSIRAWQPRRLGPGAYSTTDITGKPNYQFEQPGELLLEGSIEYRAKMFSFIHGAIFADVGNVWMTRKDEARPGAHFKAESLPKELAVGAGVGLRLDFSFLIFRWDIGAKIWDPAQQKTVPWNSPHKLVHNIGIGYPF